jgi:hypothetical protein
MKKVMVIVALLVCFFGCMPQAKADEPLDFAFGENGSWVILRKCDHGRQYISYQGVSTKLTNAITEHKNQGNSWLGVGLDGKNGFILVSENSTRVRLQQSNVYASVTNKIQEIRNKGWYVKDVALTTTGGYVIIYGQSNYSKNGWTYSGDVPESLKNYFKGTVDGKIYPIGVGITPNGGWALVYTHEHCNKWHMRSQNIPKGAADHIEANF